ncbi:lipase family protein [Actinomarinicola tropica]|uniref:Lipase n=1 Tax=Actinomarinicola tropica TaxID=2789776 RepID=A0A5Q2RM37_9ACTN|nr:lipase family protein [Actinomarinicola tropica]QGG94255.1 lipase [Actinomarinicola tropica]
MGGEHGGRPTTASAWRLPLGVRAVLGVVAVLIGGWLLPRPVAALAVVVWLLSAALVVQGLRLLLAARSHAALAAPSAAALVVGGAGMAWPEHAVRVLAVVVPLAVIGAGIAAIVRRRGTTRPVRASAVAAGLAAILLGGVALRWPDLTAVGIGVLGAILLVVGGVRELVAAAGLVPPRPGRRVLRVAAPVGAVVSLVVAVALAGASVVLHRGEPTVPSFYATPDDVPDEAGRLVRVEPYLDVPAGAEGWRILYTTTGIGGRPALSSGVVVAPIERQGARPVVTWAHGSTGVDRTCAPSLLDEGLEAGAFFLDEEVVDQGWVLVASDYVGLGTEGPHPYLVGGATAPAVLDAVRAARELDGLDLADETVVWGHSQGGAVALWTGQDGPGDADELGVVGIAALAPVSDVGDMVDVLDVTSGGSIFAAYVVTGYDAAYDDVVRDDHVVPTGRLVVDGLAGRCLAEPQIAVSAITSLATEMTPFTGVGEGTLAARLAENVPDGPYDVPLLVAQGGVDLLVRTDMQERFVARLCAQGEDVELRTYEGLGHVALVEEPSPLVPDLLRWTAARFEGEPTDAACGP